MISHIFTLYKLNSSDRKCKRFKGYSIETEQANYLECYTLISYIILLKRYANLKAFKAKDGNVTPKLKSSIKGGKNLVKGVSYGYCPQ